jgi:hypothetical protein
MTLADLLPWLNLLLVPMIGATWHVAGALVKLKTEIVVLQTMHEEHQRRIGKLESNLGELR